MAGLLLGASGSVGAQTDYYNTDAGRPITVEDAYATERYAFEVQLAPLRLERSRGGVYAWGLEPELAYGVLPRTHIEVGMPLAYVEAGGFKRSGLAGIDVSVLHNLNAETQTLPAFGVVVDALLPVGGLGPSRTYVSGKAIITRTYPWARFHLNGRYTVGYAPTYLLGSGSTADAAVEVSRWLGGVAIDRTFPLRSLLITAETFARQPLDDAEDVEWNAAAGVRYQLSPYFNVDGGLGRRLTGDAPAWFVTFGLSRAFGIRALFPVKS